MDKLHRKPPKKYPEMINRRLQQIRFTIEDLKLDGILVTHLPHIRYMTNFSGSSAYLFILQDELHFITDDRYEMQVKGELYDLPGLKVHSTREIWNYLKENKVLGSAENIGFEADRMPYSEAVEIRTMIRPIKFKPTSGEIEPFLTAKDPMEIEYIEKTSKISQKVYDIIKSEIKIGMTESEITNKIAYKSREFGSESVPFHIICTSGVNTALPHIRPTSRKVKEGDLIMMEHGATFNGFATTICRTVGIGEVDKEYFTAYNMILEAQNATIKNLRPGINASILESYARKIILEGGYGDYYKTNLAHGVGISYNENPIINQRNSNHLVPENCVLSIEPAVYVPNKFGMRIKDSVLVTKSGARPITVPPDSLEIISG
ncbi:Xaa-Pro peptidase family protein [Candidatus Kapabacteria bacterium]|nr:Xaa-Pro peptidase family protein [Candidatus Kapabacteria bacterium]